MSADVYGEGVEAERKLSRCKNFVSFWCEWGYFVTIQRVVAKQIGAVLFLFVSFCFFLFPDVSQFVSL